MSKKGYKQTEEHKKRISEAHKAKGELHWSHRPEVKVKLIKTLRSDNWLGKKRSSEDRKKFSDSHIGKVSGMKDKKHTADSKRKISEAGIGRKQSLATIVKRIKKGEQHYNWQGGKSFEPYATDWTSTLRRSIRERDFYTCQLCKEPQGDRAFDVHHIDYNKKNCNPENLITLCGGCHTKTNFNREKWQEHFANQ